MRIAINAVVTPVHKTGAGNYVISLIDALQEVERENHYYIFVGADTSSLFHIHKENFHLVVLPFRFQPRVVMRLLHFVWLNSLIAVFLLRHHINVLHLTNTLPLLVKFVPTVATIHDLTEYRVGNKYPWHQQQYRKLATRLLALRADRIITGSFNTKRELATILGVKDDKICVTPYGIPLLPVDDLQPANESSKFDIGGDYLLYVGKMLPHKNLMRLVEAFHILKSEHGIQHRLVMAGELSRHTDELQALALELGILDHLIFTGYVEDSDLMTLYNSASVLVFPSLSEGFGFPILEAMRLGVPVVTSNISSVAEIAGDAAVLVDPFEIQAIANGILQVITDTALAKALALRGQRRAVEFTWVRCAQLTQSIYASVAEDVLRM